MVLICRDSTLWTLGTICENKRTEKNQGRKGEDQFTFHTHLNLYTFRENERNYATHHPARGAIFNSKDQRAAYPILLRDLPTLARFRAATGAGVVML